MENSGNSKDKMLRYTNNSCTSVSMTIIWQKSPAAELILQVQTDAIETCHCARRHAASDEHDRLPIVAMVDP